MSINDDDIFYSLIESINAEREKKEVKKAYAKAKVINDCKKWERIGLLEGIIDENDRIILSIFFEESLEYLVNFNTNNSEERLVTLVFSTIRRIFSQGKFISIYENHNEEYYKLRITIREFNIQFIKHLNDFFNLPNVIDKINQINGLGIDAAETELIAMYCESFEISMINTTIDDNEIIRIYSDMWGKYITKYKIYKNDIVYIDYDNEGYNYVKYYDFSDRYTKQFVIKKMIENNATVLTAVSNIYEK